MLRETPFKIAAVILSLSALSIELQIAVPAEAGSRSNQTGGSGPANGMFRRLGKTQFRHQGYVTDVAFSPNGKLVASCSKDRTVRIWNLATGNEVACCKLKHAATAIKFSPNGGEIAIGNNDGLWVWTGKSKQAPVIFRKSETVYSVLVAGSPVGVQSAVVSIAYSKSGKLLAWVDAQGTLELWKYRPKTRVRRIPGVRWFQPGPNHNRSILFSPDARSIAVLRGDRTVRLYPVIKRRPVKRLVGHRDDITGMVFSPNSKVIFTCSADGSVRKWELTSSKSITLLPKHRDGCDSLAICKKGKWMATSDGRGKICIWDVSKKKLLRTMQGAKMGVSQLAFAPDCRTLAAAGEAAAVRLWDTRSGRPAKPMQLSHIGGIHGVCLSPDGRFIASCGADRNIHIWNLRLGKVVRSLKGHTDQVSDIIYCKNPHHLITVSYDGTIRRWNSVTGKAIWSYKAHGGRRISSAVYSARTHLLVTFGGDGRIGLWDARKCKRLFALSLSEGVRDMAFCPRGTELAYALSDTVVLWDTQSRSASYIGQDGDDGISALSYSRDGHFLAIAAASGSVRVIELKSKQQVFSTHLPVDYGLTTVCFGCRGRLLVCGAENGRIIYFDMHTGKLIRNVSTNAGCVFALANRDHTSCLVSGHADSTLVVWYIDRIASQRKNRSEELSDKVCAQLWTKLASDNASQAHKAHSKLIRSPKNALRLLTSKLKPVSKPNDKEIDKLIRNLSHDSFRIRTTAARKLKQLGDMAVPALRAELRQKPTVHAKQLISDLLKKARTWSRCELRFVRAIRVLEFINTAEAKSLITKLVGGAPSRLTHEVKASLRRLKSGG